MVTDKDFILGMQQGFIEAAEWADGYSIEEYDDSTTYEKGNGFRENAIKLADSFVESFYGTHKELLRECELSPDYCGHNLWLTIMGHGAGFWDRGLGDIGDKLTAVCE